MTYDEDLAEPGAASYEMRGRSMKGWLRVDDATVPDDAGLQWWVYVGVASVAGLPPK